MLEDEHVIETCIGQIQRSDISERHRELPARIGSEHPVQLITGRPVDVFTVLSPPPIPDPVQFLPRPRPATVDVGRRPQRAAHHRKDTGQCPDRRSEEDEQKHRDHQRRYIGEQHRFGNGNQSSTSDFRAKDRGALLTVTHH
ncbi:hypothetical protein [Rhodococcus aetherivorans]|uniref:hypothetical protein n=1 Tax=Rhodococcus aetherivorans TaxID=191292 RepID=UPI002949D14A|nr:hypothetical protein [Rhodococcus aetherivorans]MDV6296936.1 hypothetical protein [Rhodococcus aetherivorans]